MDAGKLFDAEYRFMSLMWDYEPVNSTELVKICGKELGWKKSTTYSMIKRLSLRGIVMNENTMVTTLVKRDQVQKYEAGNVLAKVFDGSLPSFITTFLSEKNLSREEADEIIKIIKGAVYE